MLDTLDILDLFEVLIDFFRSGEYNPCTIEKLDSSRSIFPAFRCFAANYFYCFYFCCRVYLPYIVGERYYYLFLEIVIKSLILSLNYCFTYLFDIVLR